MVVASALASAALPSTAGAAQRLVSPSGATDPNCNPTPCGIEHAIETVAQTGDEVIVAPGTYNLGANDLRIESKHLNVHGADGQPRPRITTTQFGFILSPEADGLVLRHLQVETVQPTVSVDIQQGDITLSDLVLVSSAASISTVAVASNDQKVTLLRDSVVRATGSSSSAIHIFHSVAQLRNLTVVAPAASSTALRVGGITGTPATATAKNVIVR